LFKSLSVNFIWSVKNKKCPELKDDELGFISR
jgi:hypothetical protein